MNANNNLPIMPKATCIWLIDNTSLTFDQIGRFCGIHELEVKAMADGVASAGIDGTDPISSKQLTKEEIERCTKDPSAHLKLSISSAHNIAKKKKNIGPGYTPIARRQDKPDAIYWLLKNCPNIQNTQIVKLIGTTKSTIEAIRDRSHWNMKNIKPRDPVLLGLTSQSDLDKIIAQVQILAQNPSNN
jgi:uncharacterized protein